MIQQGYKYVCKMIKERGRYNVSPISNRFLLYVIIIACLINLLCLAMKTNTNKVYVITSETMVIDNDTITHEVKVKEKRFEPQYTVSYISGCGLKGNFKLN